MILDALQNTALAASLLALALLLLLARTQRRPSYPPGPPRRWLVGNLFDLPTGPEQWRAFAAMGKKYGPVVHLGVLVRDIVVLNSFRAAQDLLDKRSAIYSDRARFPMVGELMGFEWTVAMQRYGDYWRQHRRAIHQHFNESATKALYPELTRLNAVFLSSLLRAPDGFWEHTRWLAGANIMSVTYGLDSQLADDPYIRLGEESLQIASRAGAQGAYLVDVVPWLKYLPEWLPGMGFKRQARVWKATQLRARDEPVDFVKKELAAGTARRSMTSQLLSTDMDGQPIPEDVIRNSTGMVYFAGADTSVGTMHAFILAMANHPSAQHRAQAELDAHLSASAGGRMPTLGDRAALPYVEALLREVVRVWPVLPLGVPHRVMQDDVYEGMRIPKDALILPNAWAMFNDEAYYPHPETFDPGRFLAPDGRLDPSVLDPGDIAFGFGRRVCPGRHFADAEVWLMVASVLYCFDIAPAAEGAAPSGVLSSGIVWCVGFSLFRIPDLGCTVQRPFRISDGLCRVYSESRMDWTESIPPLGWTESIPRGDAVAQADALRLYYSALTKFECRITPRDAAKEALVLAGV